MGTVVLLAIAIALSVYTALLALPRFSPRMQMVARMLPQPPAGPAGGSTLGTWLRLWLTRRNAMIARAYPDLLTHLATQARAGAGAVDAFASAPAVLPQPLRGEVEELNEDLRAVPLPIALERFAERCALPEIHTFVRSVIHQQSLGIPVARVLADEERHALALVRQAARQRIRQSAVIMAAGTAILLMNGVAIYLMPLRWR